MTHSPPLITSGATRSWLVAAEVRRQSVLWRWLNWGSIIATTLWLAASWGFAFYVEQFGSYNKIYGTLAAVVILLLWLWLSSFAILLGAEINAERERNAKGASQPDQT